ncbi:MFS transporter [Nocardioides kongjuensis]|uniref:Putative MFS family arabinose efflux permease n=1 Tax=Nocardioides kongjuensis TaxID=349522 RepID=A0A852R233_9ACTN|nr:MFS transporter [Nocardioides kongjuensis]NYD28823.1 putative MFS family arabinose efflux permease [Nocardioides kongjuensis]
MTTGQEAREDRWVLPGILLVTTVTGVVGSLGTPLVTGIARTEGVSLVTAQWAITATLVTAAVVCPVVGRIGAGRRRRPALLGCLVLVVVGTALGALPLGFGPLLVGRVLQGLAFAIVPLAFSIARSELPEEKVRGAVAAISVANVTAAGLGFPVTAFVATVAGTKGAFGWACALAVAALVVALLVVPDSDEDAPRGVDWFGAVLLSSATAAVLLAVTQAKAWGATSPPTLGLLGGGVLAYGACGWWLLRAERPLVDLRVAVRPGVLVANACGLLAALGMFVLLSVSMILVQTTEEHGYGLGRSVAVAGLMLTPYAVTSVLGSRIALWLGRFVPPDVVLACGCLLFAVANLALALGHDALWKVTLAVVIGGFGSGMTFNSMPWLMVRFVPPAETGSALSLNLVLRFLGMSTGSALALAVLAAFAASGRQTSESGFVAGGLAGAALSLLAAVTCLVLGRTRRTEPETPERIETPTGPSAEERV